MALSHFVLRLNIIDINQIHVVMLAKAPILARFGGRTARYEAQVSLGLCPSDRIARLVSDGGNSKQQHHSQRGTWQFRLVALPNMLIIGIAVAVTVMIALIAVQWRSRRRDAERRRHRLQEVTQASHPWARRGHRPSR